MSSRRRHDDPPPAAGGGDRLAAVLAAGVARTRLHTPMSTNAPSKTARAEPTAKSFFDLLDDDSLKNVLRQAMEKKTLSQTTLLNCKAVAALREVSKKASEYGADNPVAQTLSEFADAMKLKDLYTEVMGGEEEMSKENRELAENGATLVQWWCQELAHVWSREFTTIKEYDKETGEVYKIIVGERSLERTVYSPTRHSVGWRTEAYKDVENLTRSLLNRRWKTTLSAQEAGETPFARHKQTVQLVLGVVPDVLPYVSKKLKEDFHTVLIAVMSPFASSDTLKFAGDNLKKDKPLVEAAVWTNPRALKWASDELRKDEDVLLTAVTRNGMALKFEMISEDIADDEDEEDEEDEEDDYEYESQDILADRLQRISLEAVKQNGMALQFYNDDLEVHLRGLLHEVYQVVLAAVRQNGMALQHMPECIANDDDHKAEDREILFAAVKQNGMSLQYVNLYYDDDSEYVHDLLLAAVNQNGMAASFFPSTLGRTMRPWQLKEIFLAAVNQNGGALGRFGSEFLALNDENMREVCFAAVEQDESALWIALYRNIGNTEGFKYELALAAVNTWGEDALMDDQGKPIDLRRYFDSKQQDAIQKAVKDFEELRIVDLVDSL